MTDRPTLVGWFIQPESINQQPAKRTIVFMHENAGVITNRLDWFENLIKKLEVNIFTVSYRGYGDSEGEPTELGL